MECCEVVKAIEGKKAQQARHRKQAAARRKLAKSVDKAMAAAERESQRLERLRERFDAVAPGDVVGLAKFAAEYILQRHKKQLCQRDDDGVFAPYLKRLQDDSDLIYRAYQAGELTRNQMIELHIPLVEIRARRQMKSNRQLMDDIESTGHYTLCSIFDDLPEVDNFAAFLVRAVDCDILNFLSAERNATRHQQFFEGRTRVDPDRMAAPYNHVAEVDARDEIESLARDDVDRTILRMRAEGFRDKEIGACVGLSQQAVSARACKMEERLAIVAADSIDDAIVTMKVDGKSDKQIAKALNINVSTVLARHGSLEREYDRRMEQLHTLLA
jgi:hypothetical protein